MLNNQMPPQGHNKNNLNLNLMQQQQQQQQAASMGPPITPGLGNSTAANNLNNLSLNLGGMSSANNLNSSNPQAPQIQHQLIESFRLAVSAGLISPDLLNTKLPQEVLTLLYQLFQTLTQYISCTNKVSNLNKRRTQTLPQQFKSEMDIMNQELQSCKDNLVSLQAKINAAHMILKQQGANGPKLAGNMMGNQASLNNTVTTPPAQSATNSLIGGLSALNITSSNDSSQRDQSQLNELNMHKENSFAQRSKLLQLLSEPNGSMNGNGSSNNKGLNSNNNNNNNNNQAMNQLNRQSSQPGPQPLLPQNRIQSQLSQPNSFFQNYSANSSNWSNFKL